MDAPALAAANRGALLHWVTSGAATRMRCPRSSCWGRLHTGVGVVHADNMGLIALMAQHMEPVQQFIIHTVGDLSKADKSLRQALRVFLAEGST